MLALVVYHYYWPRSPVNLSDGDNMVSSGLYERWKEGGVVVLVRHGERCDSSSHECLGPKDGITVVGRSISMAVGQSFEQLGLGSTDVMVSPATRTLQTAQSMFGPTVNAQRWLHDCDETLIDQAIAHKKDKRNLILVTHSGCISKVESEHGYPRAPKSEYASALFFAVDGHGKASIRGILNHEDWASLSTRID